MELITTQSSRYRDFINNDDVVFVDVTRSWGDVVFAPSVALLSARKIKDPDKQISWKDYRLNFLVEMRKSFRDNTSRWMELISSEKTVVIACACKYNANEPLLCHRLLLVEIFNKLCQKHNIPFIYKGEHVKDISNTYLDTDVVTE